MSNHYATMGLDEDASEEDVRKAFRRLAKEYHPDVNPSISAQAKFILIHQAYEVLCNREKKFAYDQLIKRSLDPFQAYARRAYEAKLKEEAENAKKYEEFLKRKEEIQRSKLYYPYFIALHAGSFMVMGIAALVLIACIAATFYYHFFMFFFLLPFICIAAFLLKFTYETRKKYKSLFE